MSRVGLWCQSGEERHSKHSSVLRGEPAVAVTMATTLSCHPGPSPGNGGKSLFPSPTLSIAVPLSFLLDPKQSDFPCCLHAQGLFLGEQWMAALEAGWWALGQGQTVLCWGGREEGEEITACGGAGGAREPRLKDRALWGGGGPLMGVTWQHHTFRLSSTSNFSCVGNTSKCGCPASAPCQWDGRKGIFSFFLVNASKKWLLKQTDS